MLNYIHQFFKIRVVFHTLYLFNEVGDPQFLGISDTRNSFCGLEQTYQLENFRVNVLNYHNY